MKIVVVFILGALAVAGLVFTRMNPIENNQNYSRKYSDLLKILFQEKHEMIARKLDLLLKDKGSFILNHEEIFSDYYITEETKKKELVLMTIAYYLQQGNHLIALDWKQETTDVLYFVNELLKEKGTSIIKVSEEDFTLETYEFLELCSRLMDTDYCLVELGRGNDAYDIVIIEKEALDRFQTLNKDLELSMTVMN